MWILGVYTLGGGVEMATAKGFRSGNSQGGTLSKQFRVKAKELEISRRGDEIVLREKRGNLARAFDLLAGLPEDFEIPRREKDKPEQRKGLCWSPNSCWTPTSVSTPGDRSRKKSCGAFTRFGRER